MACTSAERQARWRAHNPEKHKESVGKYLEKNRILIYERQRRNRARREGREWEIYTEEQALEKYGADCHLCHEPIDLNAPRSFNVEGWELGFQLDHLVPVSKGGGDTLENVRPSHGWCNASKHDKSL